MIFYYIITKREIKIMAGPKGAKDIFPRVTKKQLEAWPEASQFVFDDWVLELLSELPEEHEEIYVHKQKIGRGRRGNPIEIDGVIYDNAIEASRFLYVSNTTIHNWLRNGKAKRI